MSPLHESSPAISVLVLFFAVPEQRQGPDYAGPLQSKGMCLLDFPAQSHSRP